MKGLHSALLNDDYFQDFFLCCCELQEYEPGSLSKLWMRDHYTVCYTVSGEGTLIFGRQKQPLPAKQGILVLPGKACRYEAGDREAWRCLRVGFSGQRAESVLSELSLHTPGRRFFCGDSRHLEMLAQRLLDSTRGTFEQMLLRQSLFYEFLSVLIRDFGEEGHLEGGFNEYVLRAIQWIREHYDDPKLRVADVADHVGISRNYLFTLFKETMDHSPQEYIASFRLSRARELLAGTEYSIDNISYACGYQDPAVFSRAFKKKYQMSPSAYRLQKPGKVY